MAGAVSHLFWDSCVFYAFLKDERAVYDIDSIAQYLQTRRLSTPDAIFLASCVELKQAHGIKIDVFHTFDDGKKRDPVDGKMVPLLSYQEWCHEFLPSQMVIAQPVIDLNRGRPIHPSPKMTF